MVQFRFSGVEDSDSYESKGYNSNLNSNKGEGDSDIQGSRGYDSDAAALLARGRTLLLCSPTIDKHPVCCTGCLTGLGIHRQEEGFVFVVLSSIHPSSQLYLSDATYICLPARFAIIVYTEPHSMTSK